MRTQGKVLQLKNIKEQEAELVILVHLFVFTVVLECGINYKLVEHPEKQLIDITVHDIFLLMKLIYLIFMLPLKILVVIFNVRPKLYEFGS